MASVGVQVKNCGSQRSERVHGFKSFEGRTGCKLIDRPSLLNDPYVAFDVFMELDR